jgi:hypothetical protein
VPRSLSVFGALIFALASAAPVAAQDSSLVVPGAYVRYWLPEMSKPIEAVVLRRTGDSVRVRRVEFNDSVAFVLSSLGRLEVRTGPEGQGATGAALGIFGGAIVGSFQFEHGGRSSGSYQGDVLRAYVFAIACAAVGWLLGSRVHRYRWESVPLGPGAALRGERLLSGPAASQ